MTIHHAQVRPDARMRWVELPGTDPARVYVHGLGSTSPAYFAGVATHPALAGRRSLLVDLLGHGISDRPATFGYTLAEQADVLAAALDTAGVRGAEVVAHSMGGSVAILLAARRPDLVARLVAIEANLDPTPRPRIADWPDETTFAADGFAAALDAAGPDWAATMRLADPVAVHRSERSLGAADLRAVLTTLPMPTVYVQGARSGPLAGHAGLTAAGVDVRVVDGAGHNVMLDNPDGFAAAVA
ncbi:alpha/beta fold hydrolase [Actinocatenispora rupis]|uniref:Alpha/beta hydrolase n=1 Tax=Actinocatenispora rupis TaxID=519421 RepID=A0A8J3NCL2_9ACTN|nr:alpha/beta fold hydrolase [Actinocatenispora rupis]GID14434.1 alpha/beta hydrolase [Actinocatenispora rupis]